MPKLKTKDKPFCIQDIADDNQSRLADLYNLDVDKLIRKLKRRVKTAPKS